MIDKKKLEFYLQHNKNVLLIGHPGIGKTIVPLQLFEELKLNYLYRSGSTLDPYIDFVGCPKEINGKLKLIRPEDIDEDNVEVIFIDELNRAPVKVMNAVMELIQFRSIHGRKFPKLKAIWAAVNPYDEDGTYNVNKLDEAQLSRFHVHLEIPYDVNVEYFTEKFQNDGKLACEWWSDLPEEIKHKVPPRRLDYALEIYKINGDLRDILPKESNVSKLINVLDKGSIKEQLDKISKQNTKEIIKWINNENNYASCIDKILTSNTYKDIFLPLLNREKLSALISSKYDALKYVTHNYFINNNLNDAINKILLSADKDLRRKIHKGIEDAIPKFEFSIKKLEMGKNPIMKLDFFGQELLKNQTFDLKKGTEERTKLLHEIEASIPQQLSNDDPDKLLSLLDNYCKFSHYTTITKNRDAFMRCFNSAILGLKLNGLTTIEEIYITIFNKYNKLYTRIHGCNLYEYCLL